MRDLISVKYIGKRPEYIDGAYGTRILFVQGESRMVPADKARLMLKHPDVYVPGEPDALDAVIEAPKNTEEDDVQDVRDAISNMGKEALEVYAKTHFSVDLDRRQSVGKLRSQVVGYIDQFGAP